MSEEREKDFCGADSGAGPSPATAAAEAEAISISNSTRRPTGSYSLSDSPQSSSRREAPFSIARNARDAQWVDAHMGREAALMANGVVGVTQGATKMAGWTIGDPKLHVKSGLRSLGAMHLRVSARVHHVAFFHPSLDPQIASLSSAGRQSENSSLGLGPMSTPAIGGKIKGLIGGGKDRSEYATEDTAQLAKAVESECYRLSRDGIVEQHYKRRSKAGRRSSDDDDFIPAAMGRSDSSSVPHTGTDAPADEGAGMTCLPSHGRQFIVCSRIPQSAESKKSGVIEHPEAVLRSVLKKDKARKRGVYDPATSLAAAGSNRKQGYHRTTSTENDNGNKVMEALRKEQFERVPFTASAVFDKAGVAGDGPLLASLIKPTPAAKLGRYLPEVACRVPASSVCFALRGQGRHIQSTQPFVVMAPHVIFGGGRDRLIQGVAADGNPLVNARKFEYLSNDELFMTERTESLLCAAATVWVDVDKKPKKSPKTAKDVAKGVAKTGQKVAKGIEKATAKTVDARGIKNTFRFKTPKKKRKKEHDDGEKEGSTASCLPHRHSHENEDDNDNQSEGRPAIEQSLIGELRLAEAKDALPDENPTTNEVDLAIDLEMSQEDHSQVPGAGGSAGVSTASAASVSSSLLPDAPTGYVLVLDDILDFRVVGFPNSDILASFPISVASILNSVPMEERLGNPRRPSELTVTLVQEPSIKEKQWGVEAKVTFRVVEVRPDTPLAVEKPEQDEKGRWTKATFDDKIRRARLNLRNIGKSREQIEKEIKEIEQKEEQMEEEREAAIIAAGCGKGYEQGAPSREIIRRQMFYDPEREVFKRKPRMFNSQELDSDLVKRAGHDSINLDKRGSTPSEIEIPVEAVAVDQHCEVGTAPVAERKTTSIRNKKEELGMGIRLAGVHDTFKKARDLKLNSGTGDSDVEGDESSLGEDNLFVSAKMDNVGNEIKPTEKENDKGSGSGSGLGSTGRNGNDELFVSEKDIPASGEATEKSANDADNVKDDRDNVKKTPTELEEPPASVVRHASSSVRDNVTKVQPKSSKSLVRFNSDIVPTLSEDGEIWREEGEEEAERRKEEKERKEKNDRRRMQSVALMHLSLAGGKVGESEYNMLQGMFDEKKDADAKRHEDEESIELDFTDEDIDAHASKNDGTTMSGQLRSSVKAGERVLLEEYPGVLLLCLVVFGVVALRLIFLSVA